MSLDFYLLDCHKCSACGHRETSEMTGVFSRNITHNLNQMADAAGIYEHLWRPDEIGVARAEELIGPLREGLAKLMAEPERFAKFNPENGWGSYSGLVEFVKNVLAACEEHPDATVRASR